MPRPLPLLAPLPLLLPLLLLLKLPLLLQPPSPPLLPKPPLLPNPPLEPRPLLLRLLLRPPLPVIADMPLLLPSSDSVPPGGVAARALIFKALSSSTIGLPSICSANVRPAGNCRGLSVSSTVSGLHFIRRLS